MPRTVIAPPGWPSPRAPHPHAVMADNVLYVSGLVGQRQSGGIPATVEEQTKLVLEMLRTIVEHAGGSLADVTMYSVF